MKSKFLAAISCLLLALGCVGLLGCSHPASKPAEPAQETKKVKVVASFYPMADFAKKIGGDLVEVTTIIPTGTEPHDWEPAAEDITKIGEAQLFVYNGLGMEPWVDSVMKTLGDKAPKTVEASKKVNLLAVSEEHAHEHEEAEGHDHDHAEGHDHDHEHGEYDPHAWLSLKNAAVEMRAICDALKEVDPKNADQYEANYKKASEELAKLDKEYEDTLSQAKLRKIVVSHEAYGYLCRDYKLEQVGITGLSADHEPDARRMAEIVNYVRNEGIRYIFFEDLVSPKVAEAIAHETGAKTACLNPLEGLTDEQIKAGADYFSVMKDNLAILKAALVDTKA